MEGSRCKMGDKYVHVKGSDLVIDHKKYIGTQGLCSLITKRHPTAYSREDLNTYRDVILHTNEEEESPSQHHRVTRSIKQKHGNGVVQFLPGNIKWLETKLNYLIGEYRAGNRLCTRNEIVSILDELLRRRKISRKEYKDIITFLQ